MQNQYEMPVEEILDRMREELKVKTDIDLGAKIEVSPNTIKTWKQRKVIPFVYLRKFHSQSTLSMEYLLYGALPKRRYVALHDADGGLIPLPTAEDIQEMQRRTGVARPSDSEFVFLPHYDAKTANGEEIEALSHLSAERNCFRKGYWLKEVGLPPEECFTMDLVGNSMAPYLTERHVAVFHREPEVNSDSVYVFRYQGEHYVKRLQRVPDEGLLASSYDQTLKAFTIGKDGDFKVIGRLVFKQLGERV